MQKGKNSICWDDCGNGFRVAEGGPSSRLEIGCLQPCCMTAYIHTVVKIVSKFVLTVINTATFRNAILQTKEFPSIYRLVTPTTPLELLLRPSVHISAPIALLQLNRTRPQFATREMTKTPQTRPKTSWKILKATGTVQYKPTFAPPTKEKLAQTKKKWDL